MPTYRWEYLTSIAAIGLVDPDSCLVGSINPTGTPGWWYWRALDYSGNAPTLADARANVLSTAKVTNVTGWEQALAQAGWSDPPRSSVSPEQVRNALLKDPALLWGTLQLLKEIKIVGPWQSHGDGVLHLRAHPADNRGIVHIMQRAGFCEIQYPDKTDTAPTLEEAKQKADAYLRREGWLLA